MQLDLVFLGNSLRTWALALGTLLIGFVVLLALHRLLLGRLKRLSEATPSAIDDLVYDMLLATKRYFLFVLAVFVASLSLEVSPHARLILSRVSVLFFLFQVSLWGSRAIAFWIDRHLRRRSASDTSIATSLGLIGFAAKFVFFSVILMLAIHNLGIDITALIAGLGVGGIAVALAMQNILGDLFASLSIVLDKPFVVGDFIVVGEFMGTIEYIGLKTTRLRSLSGEQLVFSNSDLLQSRIRNFKRMSERRVVCPLGVTYQTSQDMLARIPGVVREIVEATSGTRFDRCHFLKFGASSLDFELVYWVNSADFNTYADIAQAINLEIFRRFGEAGIDFAYPSQTLFLQRQATEEK